MALRQWRVVEEELKRSGVVHPLLLRCIGEMYERMRVMHQQDVQIATAYGTLVDRFNDMVTVTGHMDKRMEKLGLKEGVDELEGDQDEVGSTHDMTRDRKN